MFRWRCSPPHVESGQVKGSQVVQHGFVAASFHLLPDRGEVSMVALRRNSAS
jgi:hypothetical protein